MNFIRLIILVLCFFPLICSCEKISPDVVEIKVEYSWGTQPGENRKNPEIKLTGIPKNAKFLKVELVDLDMPSANHGGVEKIISDGSGVIPYGLLKNYIGPTPPPQGHLYEFTIKASAENGVITGIGKKAETCCPRTKRQRKDEN